MWVAILFCGFLLLGFCGIIFGQTDVSPSTEDNLPPDATQHPTSVTLNPIPAVDEFCPFLLNCTVTLTQKGVAVVQLLKLFQGTWIPVFIYNSKSQELQFIQDGVENLGSPPLYVLNVTSAALSDAGPYRCLANDSSGAVFQDSKNVTVKEDANDCDVLCEHGAMCNYGCKTYVCVCSTNWMGASCKDACVNARVIRNSSEVILGNSITISCVANSKSSNVFWSRTAIDFNISSINKLTQNGTLTIARALAGDVGSYYCYVNSSDCVSRQQVNLNVIWDVPPTNFIPMDLQKTEGDSLELICNVTTRPVAVLYWQFAAESTEKDSSLKTTDCHLSSSTSSSTSSSSASPSSSSSSPSNSSSSRSSSLSSSSSSSSTTSNGIVPSGTDALLCDPLTTTVVVPVILGNKTKSLSRLFIQSLAATDAGLYTCQAELPGDMTFILSMYNVFVGPVSTGKPRSSSETSSSGDLLALWMVAVIVYGVMLTGVGVIVAVFMLRLKCENKQDPQVMPVCDEADSCSVKCDSPDEDVCDGDDLYGYYDQQDEAADDDDEANLAPQQQIKSYLRDLPPLHGHTSDKQNWNLPPLNDLSAAVHGGNTALRASVMSPPIPSGDSIDGGPGVDRRRRRKIIRE